MTSAPPPSDSRGPYGASSPSYGLAPTPGGGGHDPYADPTAFASGGQAGATTHGGGQGSTPGPPSGKRRIAAVVISTVLVTVVGLALVGWFVWPGWGQPSAGPTPAPSESSTVDEPATSGEAATDPATTDPTTDPSGSDDTSIGSIDADGRMNGPGYSYDLPAGWALDTESGGSGIGTVVDGAGSDITVWIIRQGMNHCLAEAEVLQIWNGGTIEPLPDREIGGVTAIGNGLAGDAGGYDQLWCADVAGVVYEIGLTTPDRDAVQPLFTQVLDSWEWAAT